jgi:hypothetical protein
MSHLRVRVICSDIISQAPKRVILHSSPLNYWTFGSKHTTKHFLPSVKITWWSDTGYLLPQRQCAIILNSYLSQQFASKLCDRFPPNTSSLPVTPLTDFLLPLTRERWAMNSASMKVDWFGPHHYCSTGQKRHPLNTGPLHIAPHWGRGTESWGCRRSVWHWICFF